jgi:hypothetical protein
MDSTFHSGNSFRLRVPRSVIHIMELCSA